MNTRVLLILSLCLAISAHAAPGEPLKPTTAQLEQSKALVHPLMHLPTGLIVAEYLMQRKKLVAQHAESFKNKTREQKLSDEVTQTQASLKDTAEVHITVHRENALVILHTTVHGTAHDLEERCMLANEHQLLKYKLIKAYAAARKLPHAHATLTLLDSHTKCSHPDWATKHYFSVSSMDAPKERLLMRCKTVLTQQEFDMFVREFWPTLDTPIVPKEKNAGGWW
jgi:hypothetical protein